MAEMTNLRPTYEVSPVLAGFLGAGVLVVSVTVAVFLWSCCQRRYRRMTGAYKLNSGPYDPPVDPPYKFIHMLKGISIYPESLSSSKKIVRVGRRPGNSGPSSSSSNSSSSSSSLTSSLRDWRYGFGAECGRNRNAMVDADPEGGFLGGGAHLQMNPLVPPCGVPRLERALPIRADYCCLESSGGSSGSEPASKTATPHCPITLNLGTLSLAVDYNFPKKALVVTIMGAQGLPAVDEQAASSDPYVKMTILPEKKHRVKTRVLRKTLEPVFDETFTFYGVSYSTLSELTLHFLVLSFDRFARDDIIGEAVVPLGGVDPSTGRVHISQPITKRNVQSDSRGELLVSLSYHPATQRLNVVVLKAKHLPKMDIAGMSGNPYVKVNVFYGRKRIAKKKTHVKKCTLNPVFNESFIYDVPAELMPDLSVEFLVIDFDRTTKNEMVGRVVLGGQSPSPTGVTHWREVCDNPRRQIAKWHNLEEF
ncbi:synaptotagmin-11-like [Clupea harengus]|uniref:Synaptotagmin-11-like n=1 Tax=Clupea harengus TaxID=7950 RepID=A0A6P8GTN2_CLUHA|nr:synaptotagmin-11-like [Clupea harengus]